MKPGSKLLLLAFSLLLPAVLLVCTHVFVMAQMRLASDDRAMVWAQGEADALAVARTRIETNTVFSGGRVSMRSPANPAPADCDARAAELSFGGLSDDDAHAAREELETIARQSGLEVCASYRFLLNDPAADTAAGQLRSAAQQLILFLGVPAGVCLCLYWMFREQFGLPLPGAGMRRPGNVLAGLGAAAVAVVGTVLMHAATGEPLFDNHAAGFLQLGFATSATVLSLILGSAMIEEVAYRSWLITLSERVLGRWPAAAFSALLFALSYQPDGADELLVRLVLGGVCSVLYVRTRSLAAAITAHAGYELLVLALGIASA